MLVFAIGFAHPLPPAPPQAVAGAGNGTNRSAYIARRMAQATVAPIQLTTDGEAPSTPPQRAEMPAEKPYGWHMAIYPALAWAPTFGTSVTLPGQPNPSGSTF